MRAEARGLPVLLAAAAVAMAIQTWLAIAVAPDAANFAAPMTQRIFYYHVPAAWVAYLAFGVTAAASALVLYDPRAPRLGPRADALAVASAEIGLVFSLVALVTGLVWARQEFLGYSPLEDPKVITLGVVVLSYLAYFALRSGIDEPARRQRLAAVFGVLALVGVPLSYFASRASLHPDFTRPEESLAPELRWILLASVAAFTLLYAALATLRYRIARVERHLEENP